MDVKKCDRCGKIFELKGSENDKERVLLVFKHKDMYSGYKAETKADLCADCAKDLKEWLKGG